MNKLNEFLRELMTIGTPACALFGGLCGIVLAVLLLTIGWWRTLLIVVFCLVGLFICGVKCKKNFFHKMDRSAVKNEEVEPFMIPKEKPAAPEEAEETEEKTETETEN